MIRLPPTSISLSESDVQFHLNQIDIYQHELQHGFKRDNILSSEQHADRHEGCQRPTCVELRIRCYQRTPALHYSSGRERDEGPQAALSSTPSRDLSIRHRPRQGSTLHITHNADSFNSPVGNSAIQSPENTPEFRRTWAKVREISVNKIESPPASIRSISVTHIATSSTGSTPTLLRAEAEDFVPLRLPPPFSATRRISGSRQALPLRNASPASTPETRLQQTDGPGTVYNDQVPAYLQPQTPADLARGRYHATGREPAYTVPPGRTARTPARSVFEPGEESPSRRARTMRGRRQREMRLLMDLEEDVLNEPPRNETWEYDLAADRVGDENFE